MPELAEAGYESLWLPPPTSDGDGQPHVEILPDVKVPQPSDREVPILVEPREAMSTMF